jgi:hypothetical protein
LKPEWWGSPLVQGKYQEEKACDKSWRWRRWPQPQQQQHNNNYIPIAPSHWLVW